MGYYTRFYMGIRDKEGYVNDEHKLYDKIACKVYNVWAGTDITDFSDGQLETARETLEEFFEGEKEGKWYEHEEDMKKISADFPGIDFVLEGLGERRDDWWIKVFRDGELVSEHYAEIIAPKCPKMYFANPDF